MKANLRRLAAMAFLPWLAGCLVVPVNYHDAGSRHNISERTPAQLRPGVTTKEEVFLLLGEPDFLSEDGRRLGYAWNKVRMLVMVGSYAGGWVGAAKRSHLLRIWFDADDRVASADIISSWGDEVPPQRAETPPAGGAQR